MKRLPGQAGRTIGWVVHHTGMIFITAFFVLAFAVGLFAFRLSEGPIQFPWLASRLATIVSGQGINIHIDQAALAWGGYRQGGPAPLYVQLGGITARNAAGETLVTIRSGTLLVLPSALFGGGAPILVTSTDSLFQGSDVPASIRAAIRLHGLFDFSGASIAVELGAGTLGAGGRSVPISGGRFDVAITPDDVTVSNGRLGLAPRGQSAPRLSFAGSGHRAADWRGTLTVQADAVHADDLAAYWPADILPQARVWVTRNVGVGTATNARFTFGLVAPRTLAGLTLNSATGSFSGAGLSVGWLPGAPPITLVSGTFKLIDLDNIVVQADAGALGSLDLAGGSFHIDGLRQAEQEGTLDLPVQGSVAAALRLLNAPPLNLLAAAPPGLLAATGGLKGELTARLPLRGDVTLAQLDLHAAMTLTEVTLPLPPSGFSLTGGTFEVRSTTTDLTISGGASLAGEPAAVAVTARFGGAQPAVDVEFRSVAGRALLQGLGLEASAAGSDGVIGAVPFTVHAAQGADGLGRATLDADLSPAAAWISAFGWTKAAGEAGRLTIVAGVDRQSVAGIVGLDATGPGLEVHAAVDPADARRLDFSALRIGATSGRGSLTAPASAKAPWRADFTGPSLDLSALLSPPGKAGTLSAAKPSAGPPWEARLMFATLILAGHGAPVLHQFAFTGSGAGGMVLSAQASAMGAAPITLSVSPGAGALHPENLQLDTDDGGYLLRALGDYRNLDGGMLDLTAVARDDGTAGTLKLESFRLMHAPGFAKVLQAVTIYGAAAAASGPGLAFDRLVAPFTLAKNVLTLKGARAFSSSIGFTASGTIDLGNDEIALSTTIIPAYALNALPGKIPVVGQIFSAETGGGLFAMRARLTGRLDDPDVAVNPLSALTPGVLRDVFGLAPGAAK